MMKFNLLIYLYLIFLLNLIYDQLNYFINFLYYLIFFKFIFEIIKIKFL